MTRKEAGMIATTLAYSLIERMYMDGLTPQSYKQWEHETAKALQVFTEFILVNPTVNRSSALIRSIGEFDFWKLRGLEEFKNANLDNALHFIIARANDLELGQSFMASSFANP
jgi:hypothetical protein